MSPDITKNPIAGIYFSKAVDRTMIAKYTLTPTLLVMALIYYALGGPVYAEVYKYQDEQGHWHFSDTGGEAYLQAADDVSANDDVSAPDEIPGAGEQKSVTFQAGDKATQVIHSTLQLNIPESAQDILSNQEMFSIGATQYDKFIGGSYTILSPQKLVFREPISVSITCTADAVTLYRQLNPNVAALDLTLAVWMPDLRQYRAIDSEFDPGEMRVRGKLQQLLSGQNILVAIEKSKAYTGSGLNLASCENKQVPQNANNTERQFWINLCFQQQAVEQIDMEMCENILPLTYTSTNRVSEDICKMKVIIANPNSEVADCDVISDAEAHGKCQTHFAGQMADISACDQIRDKMQKDECLLQVAEKSSAENICAEISDGLVRKGCYKNIAIAKSNPAICEMVSKDPSLVKAFCYEGLAVKLKQPELCDHVVPILTPEARAECVEKAGSN